MGADRNRHKSTRFELQIGGYHQSGEREILVERDYQPDFQSGGWIVFPNGQRFRRPTPYVRRKVGINPGSGQNTNPAPDLRYTTSSGAWRMDALLTADCPLMDTKIPGLGKLFDFPGFPSDMVGEAHTKALNSIADQKAGIGEDLATFRQTIGLLRSPASALLGSLHKARDLFGKHNLLSHSRSTLRRSSIPKRIADRYLEYVYGWKPLMSDIHGAISLMKERGLKTMLLSGTGVSRWTYQVPETGYTDWSSNSETSVGPLRERVAMKTKVWARIDPEASALRTLNQLGLLNPASLAWELVSWSFVVDWFVPIGPVLSALTAPAGLIFVSGTDNLKVDLNGPWNQWYTYLGKVGTPGSGTVNYSSYRRDVLSDWPIPGFWFNSNPFSGDRSLKALALAISRLG